MVRRSNGASRCYTFPVRHNRIARICGNDPQLRAEAVADGAAVFFGLDEMVVNLNTSGRRQSVLKIKVALELASQADLVRVQAVIPRVVDNFQTYLRELRVDDLNGSAGLYRLREELLTRVNVAVQPAKVNAILFKEMLIQ